MEIQTGSEGSCTKEIQRKIKITYSIRHLEYQQPYSCSFKYPKIEETLKTERQTSISC